MEVVEDIVAGFLVDGQMQMLVYDGQLAMYV
jgi:hypothetical protein